MIGTLPGAFVRVRTADLVAGLAVKTPPAVEPISLAQAKAHLRVEHTVDDALIASLVTAARSWVEAYLGRALYRTVFVWTLDDFPEGTFRLPRPSVAEVSAITYRDSTGAEVALAEADFLFVASGWGATLSPAPGSEWPSTQADRPGAVTIEFVAGFAASTKEGDPDGEIPGAIKAAILLLLGHLYSNRELSSVGHMVVEVPFSVATLLAPFRVLGF